MEFYFPTHAFPQRHMPHPSQVRQHVFYPQYDDIEFVIVERELEQEHRHPLFGQGSCRQHHHHPGFGGGFYHQQFYQQEQEAARLYRQQQREYALEQQRLREEQAALYMLYRQKEQERIRRQQEHERIRRQQEEIKRIRQRSHESLLRQRAQQQEVYRRRIDRVLEERERRQQQLQQHQHALFSFLFGQEEDTEMNEPQQQSEEHPQQVAQSQMEIQQDEPETESEQEEETQVDEPQQEVSEQELSQQESEDDASSIHIRFLFSPQPQSVASDNSDDDMASEQGKDDEMTIDNEGSSDSETENQGVWEQLGEVSDDEKLAETKHLQLRMLGEQLNQLDEKHSSTIPTTRLQFADDSSSEVTAISRENRQFLGLEDEVLQVMLQLDAIDSNGDDSIRQERKSLIHKAEQLLSKMDEHKQQEWERISVSSAASA
ncbi:hypothetical protein BJV82DRAFT_622791 [Fennellomyces sp. T-0311]|nr:hypothetical protein BJV82DRAFT_622791 [Fennellomyces sp. T-0311]